MSRRHAAEKREVLPDAKYGDIVVTKFMNCLMYQGKKSAAETIVYGAMSQVEKKAKGDPVKMFQRGPGQREAASRGAFPAASAVRPTRCRSKSAPIVRRLWRSAGSSPPPAAVPSRP